MQTNPPFDPTQQARQALVEHYRADIDAGMAAVHLEMDQEIEQEIRGRIAVLMFNEAVNDLPGVPYIAVWEGGADEIAHAYLSPKIESLCGYSPHELASIGYINIVGGDILSFYRDEGTVEEKVDPLADAQKRRILGFMDNRHWEGCYKVNCKDGRFVWVIDRAAITRFRNTKRDAILCLSGGMLMESTELLEKREGQRG